MNQKSATLISKNLEHDKIFKKWVKDTLIILKSVNKNNIMLNFQSDSLLLNIKTFYEIYPNQELYSLKEKNILNTLIKYNQIKKFKRIVFVYDETFYPSNIDRLKYDFSNIVTDLTLYYDDTIEVFYLNRGTFSHKNILNKDSILLKREEFIWKDGKFITQEFN